MKLRYLNVLVSTIVAAGTAGAAEIYNKDGNVLELNGCINSSYYLSNNNSEQGDHSCIHYGISGSTQITDCLSGFGVLEDKVIFQNIESNSTINNNQVYLGYAGIKYDKLGSISYGRNYGILYDVGSFTDVIPKFGDAIYIADNFLSNRASNLLTYRNNNFFGLLDGFNFAVQYQGNNDENKSTGRGVKESNGNGYGASVFYCLDNVISASAAYFNSKLTVNQMSLSDSQDNSRINAQAYSFGLRYDDKRVYLAALYGETFNMMPFGNFDDSVNTECIYGFIDKAKNIEFVAQYQFDFGLRSSVAYLHSKSGNMNGYSSYLKKYVELSTSYIFNKNMLATIGYRLNLLKNDDFIQAARISTNNVFALGVSYIF